MTFFRADQVPSLPLYTIAQLREIEQRAEQDLPGHTLMQRAGAATADFLEQRYRSDTAQPGGIWFAAGPGNNGGDALVAAAELRQRGIPVEVFLPVVSHSPNADWALQRARAAGVAIRTEWNDSRIEHGYAWCVDGLFGIGLRAPLDGVFAAVAQQLAQRARSGQRVLALDIPSGLESDTGTACAGGAVVDATDTLSFIGAKPGLYTGEGQDHSGTVWVTPLGLSANGDREDGTAAYERSDHSLWLNTRALFKAALPHRNHATHKGSFGTLVVAGGASGMLGAPILAARAALYAGTGKIHVALLDDRAPSFDPVHPELMLHPGAAELSMSSASWQNATAWAAGPGFGQSEAACAWLAHILSQTVAMVLDADALNLIAAYSELAEQVRRRYDSTQALTILTPHPLECARMLETNTEAVERDRIAAARVLASRYRSIAVLKGSGTVIAQPDGSAWINPTGNAGLATGGSGDVLTGLIGAFLAQRCAPHLAALMAVYLHGQAAQQLCQRGGGPIGLTAGELAPEVRQLLNRLFNSTQY